MLPEIMDAGRNRLHTLCALGRDVLDINESPRFCSMAKFVASDNAMKVTTDAVQPLGGYGYMKDYPVERMIRDAKLTQIYAGTNQIQRLVTAREIFRYWQQTF
jgi:alkylation response protein AidB-like acyl-CoA dehydrogenase